MCKVFTSKIIEHKVNVKHPGISDSESLEYTLIEVSDESERSYFYMDVESVVCGSKECRVDVVRIFWNELGQFSKLKMQNNAVLEKNDGIPFTNDDYQKLNGILGDVNSPLQNFYKDELVDDSHANAADAYSGATVVINKKAIVEGAVWTCYTLWHWVNGDAISYIRNISAKKYNKEDLRELLVASDVKYRVFALEQFILNKWFDRESIEQVLKMPFNSKKEIQLTMSYIENIEVEDYYKAINKLFQIYDKEQKVTLLNALLKTKQPLSQFFLDNFSSSLLQLESYQNIDLILKLFYSKNSKSLQVNNNVLRLLDNKSFLVSRNAYYFLKKQDLDKNGIKKVKLFEAKNKTKL